MTTEQREAIKTLSDTSILMNIQRDTALSIRLSIETVLALIKEQSAELLQKNAEIAEKDAEIEKKDKQIDLMSRAIDNYDSQLEINTFKDKEDIKQCFADLVEKE